MMPNKLLLTLLITAVCFISTTNGTRGKKCQPEKVELDVAMVLDASSGVDRYGYAGEKAAVISLFSSLTISQQFSFTHVATVYMGQKTAYNSSNLGTYRGSDSAKNDIRHLPYLGGDLNILRGLTKAHSVVNGYGARKSVPKVIVLFSSVPIDCEKHQPGTQAVSCEKLKELKSKGITVISVDLRYHENPTKRAMSFGDYSLQNDESLVSDIQSIFCDVSPVKDMELKPYRCPCILHGLWLNIIVSFDSSDGAGTMALAAQKAAITALLHRIFVNQRKGQFSKIAFLNTGSETQIVSNLTRYNFATEAVEEIRKIQLIGGAINLQDAFIMASQMFNAHNQIERNKEVKNVLVVFTNSHVHCTMEKPECEEAAKLQSEGVKIVTIDLSLMDREQKSSDFGDRCLLLTNDIGFMETFEYTLCRANCFCISPTIQFYDEKKCDIYGQCVYFEETAVGTESAKISCGINYMSLADVHSDSKDAFLTEIAKSYGAKEYIIGLEDVNGDFVWSNGKTLESDEYNLYGAGEPDVRHGNCTYAAIDTDGKAIWKTMSCSYTAPAKKYFCQKNTCDTKHYCSTEADQ